VDTHRVCLLCLRGRAGQYMHVHHDLLAATWQASNGPAAFNHPGDSCRPFGGSTRTGSSVRVATGIPNQSTSSGRIRGRRSNA